MPRFCFGFFVCIKLSVRPPSFSMPLLIQVISHPTKKVIEPKRKWFINIGDVGYLAPTEKSIEDVVLSVLGYNLG